MTITRSLENVDLDELERLKEKIGEESKGKGNDVDDDDLVEIEEEIERREKENES